jgi:3-oxoacyl-[acyl-carrier protein] reductase
MIQEPRLVLVTGTSRGIGRELAVHLLDRGWQVIGCSRGGEAAVTHERYVHRPVNVASEPEVVDLFRWIRTTFGRLDAVVNNAAVNPALSLTALTPASAAAAIFETNVIGVFLVCREAVKLMMRQNEGRIVNIGSMATRHEVEGEALYTASKAAVNAMTRVLAKEVAAHGITCNVLAPSAVGTGLSSALVRDRLESVLARNAVPELGTTDEVGMVLDWLLSPEGAPVTAQIVYLGGA